MTNTPEPSQVLEYIQKIVRTKLFRKHAHMYDDVVGDAVLEVWQALQRWDGRSHWKTYVHVVIMRCITRTVASEVKHEHEELDAEAVGGLEDDGWPPAVEAAREAVRQLFGEELGRQIWRMRLEEATIAECAVATGIEGTALRGLLKEALAMAQGDV